ncbi:P-loop NTPase [Psychrosphaera ytuae]|uniref:Iron-sulfur cluster carrier protein n=1 Tax=Psychrosphaera ytuae TaxID=2820710 RepID=A0A975DAV2_9GAMM|nr:P-loop NTPase [Psychrosphaera ytuae]QTH63741.1 P-loop NTPase [Psychrosphaera ytuae]
MKLSKWFGKKTNNNSELEPQHESEINTEHPLDTDTNLSVGDVSKSSLKALVFKLLPLVNTQHFPSGIFGQISVEVTNSLDIRIGVPFKPEHYRSELTEGLKEALRHKSVLSDQKQTDEAIAAKLLKSVINFYYEPTELAPSQPAQAKLVIVVSSGKGGVGKSTVTSNLAVTLAKQGYRTGVLDADIYGPSMPLMFGLQGKNVVTHDEKTMEPFYQHGVYLNSIGFLIPEDKATIWRGPMASRALMQVINETNWPELDVLLVDMPPGTGDIQLTMSETVKSHAGIVVTTPQNVALADAEKGIQMFNKVNIPVLGVVENMSQFICPSCGAEHDLFGRDGGAKCAEKHQIPLLGQLPINAMVREAGDEGCPWALKESNYEYEKMALSLIMQLSKRSPKTISIS